MILLCHPCLIIVNGIYSQWFHVVMRLKGVNFEKALSTKLWTKTWIAFGVNTAYPIHGRFVQDRRTFSPMCDLYSTTTYTLLRPILQKTRNTRLYSLYYQVYIRGNPLSNQRIPLYCCVTSSTPKADLVNCSRDGMNISSVIHVFIETVNKTWSTTHLTDIIVRKPKLFSFNNISASQQTWPAVLLVKDCDWYNFELWCLIWSVDNKFCLVSMKHPYFS